MAWARWAFVLALAGYGRDSQALCSGKSAMSASDAPAAPPSATPAPVQTLDQSSLTVLYQTLIGPQLVGFEAERVAAMGKFWLRIALGAPIAAAIAWVAASFLGAGWGIGVGALAVAFAGAYAYAPLEAVGKRAKIAVLNAIAGALGISYQLDGFAAPGFDHFCALDLLPAHDRSSTEDLFSGLRSGCAFGLYDAHLERRQRDNKGNETWVTCFRGSLIHLAFPNKFMGVTVVRRDAGLFNLFQRKMNLQRIGFGDSRFEKTFEVYGSDQVEARYLVHPVFMEKLLALETTFKGGKIRCAFSEGDLLVAVEGKDRFEIGGLFSSLAKPERVTSMAGDVTTVMGLIDTVLAGPPPAYQAEIAAARAQMAAEAAAAPPANPPIVQG
jgi:hypothetical protein